MRALVVGLTGGIGSGKSTVAALLADRGAVVIDADRIAREVVAPGQPAYTEIVDRFGSEVVAPDGTLDRGRLARIVFADEAARRDLEAITHPRIAAELSRRVAAAAEEAEVIVLDVPLLLERGLVAGLDAVVVVTAPPEVRLARLVEGRGMDPDDVRARMAAQATDDELLRAARTLGVPTYTVDNRGDRGTLEAAVHALAEELWAVARDRARR